MSLMSAGFAGAWIHSEMLETQILGLQELLY
jgi:hypothetical protein